MEGSVSVQLVSPIVGNKIYQSSSFEKGVDKCYRELKNFYNGDLSNINSFSVMNMNNYETYKYSISQKNKPNNTNINMNGGGNRIDDLLLNNDRSKLTMEELSNRLMNLEMRMSNLERKNLSTKF